MNFSVLLLCGRNRRERQVAHSVLSPAAPGVLIRGKGRWSTLGKVPSAMQKDGSWKRSRRQELWNSNLLYLWITTLRKEIKWKIPAQGDNKKKTSTGSRQQTCGLTKHPHLDSPLFHTAAQATCIVPSLRKRGGGSVIQEHSVLFSWLFFSFSFLSPLNGSQYSTTTNALQAKMDPGRKPSRQKRATVSEHGRRLLAYYFNVWRVSFWPPNRKKKREKKGQTGP